MGFEIMTENVRRGPSFGRRCPSFAEILPNSLVEAVFFLMKFSTLKRIHTPFYWRNFALYKTMSFSSRGSDGSQRLVFNLILDTTSTWFLVFSLREFSESLSFLRQSTERSSELEQRIINTVKVNFLTYDIGTVLKSSSNFSLIFWIFWWL